MKFLLICADYPDFLSWLYSKQPSLEGAPYAEQMRARNESLFGVADFFSSNLKKLGHEAWDIYNNNEVMQRAWGQEHGMQVERKLAEGNTVKILRRARQAARKTPLRHLGSLLRPTTRILDDRSWWYYQILAAQIEHYQPDVILNHDIAGISTRFLKEMKPFYRLLVGQHAAMPLNESVDYSCYGLAVSSLPFTADFFRSKGVQAEVYGLGFEPAVLEQVWSAGRDIPITFIGNLYEVHAGRIKWLERICSDFEQTKVWAPSIDSVARNSPIRGCYQGTLWGREMYEVMQRSKITLNHHDDITPYANNMRLYEATGIGTLLITDWKQNLHEIFELGTEVVSYRDADECAAEIDHYLKHEEERLKIARAGQERTLKEHTYLHRMRQLADIVEKYL